MDFKRISIIFTSFLLTVLSLLGIQSVSQEWKLSDVPSFTGGEYCEAVYNTGTGIDCNFKHTSEKSSYMQLIKNTNSVDVNNYITKLKIKGYKKVFDNRIENIRYLAFRKGSSQIYFYHNSDTMETRVIDDSCSWQLNDFGYRSNEGEAATVYQFSFPYYDAEINSNDEIYSKNGMLYVIKLADNKLIIIDAGSQKQSSDANIEIFMDFLREITKTDENEKLKIALWFGTHPHKDHILFISKLIKQHKNELDFERFMFNYCAYDVMPYNRSADTIRTQIKENYPASKYVKCRSGYKFDLANLTLEVLYTHEDAVSAEDGIFCSDVLNDTSTVLKITNAGKTFLFLGDADKTIQKTLLENFSDDILKSDVVQAAHHMINHVKKLYEAIRPSYVFCPQSEHRTIVTSNFSSYKTLLGYCDENNFFFADKGIYALTPDGDSITVSFRECNCVPYDNSIV